MSLTSRVAILPTLVLATNLAHAAPALDGSYGDKDGCRYAKTGESSGSDTFFLLTDEGVTTSTAFCAFDGPLTKTRAGFTGTATCESSGESGEPAEVELLKGTKGYTVSFDDGTRWGPLPRCR